MMPLGRPNMFIRSFAPEPVLGYLIMPSNIVRNGKSVPAGAVSSNNMMLPAGFVAQHPGAILSTPRKTELPVAGDREVRIRLPPPAGLLWCGALLSAVVRGSTAPFLGSSSRGTERWYGAGDEEMAPSSLANN
jgi:hypothetical protein